MMIYAKMKSISLLSFIIFHGTVGVAGGHYTIKDSLTVNDTSIALRSIPYADHLDSIIRCYHEELIAYDSLILLSELMTSDSVPVYSSHVYAERLAVLDKKTPFDLSHNERVEAFIHLYVTKKRLLSSNSLGRSMQYFPLFEEALDKHALPLELKYLAVVESGLNPTAKSRAGATGLWQFMYRTGKNFGLTINSYVDDRCDPKKSTEAACAYLKYLYNLFNDWDLALAAYNCGEGRVSRAIRRSGGKTYWDIYPYLPRETRGYVPAFIAVNYLFAYHQEHLIYPTTIAFYAHTVDTIHLKGSASFEQLSDVLQLDVEILKDLNPAYRLDVVPAYDKEHSIVCIPKEAVDLWVANQDFLEAALIEISSSEPISVPSKEQYYIVQSGDYLGKIAAQNHCTVSQLQQWNGLTSTRLSIGQKLVIYTDGTPAQNTSSKPIISKSGNNTLYSIRSGDTLWDIAKAQGISLDQLKRWNSDVDFTNMKPGQKIIVNKNG